jgi:ribosomal protein S18 acetylase RimI-like enzyme
MDQGNGIGTSSCRFLDDSYFTQLYEAFTEAFSDYVIPFALTEQQFRNHVNVNAVDIERTVGFFAPDGRMIGCSLNGFGEWLGLPTVYDAGTGVVPSHRRRGVSEAMFRMMLPAFEQAGMKQFVLEVVSSNIGAISLYEKLNFKAGRTLALLQCDTKLEESTRAAKVEIKSIEEPDWAVLRTFWDGRPSWQNSCAAVGRSIKLKRILGAFVNGECVGYVVFSPTFGRVAQFAVSPLHRRQGVASKLLRTVQREMADGFSMQVINIDVNIDSAMRFFEAHGFYERLQQFEMTRRIAED